jgi:hypothetical protein
MWIFTGDPKERVECRVAYESILRPVFKDDEPLMIAVGAILGALEIQVQIIEHLGH